MPWVRLHATKDYWGMAMLLKEVPEMHATINLVPSLLLQLTAYTDRGAQDEHLRVSRLPADALTEADMTYLLDNFFMVHPDHMIRPYKRYLSCIRSAACRSIRRAGRPSDSRSATFSICNAGRTCRGSIRWLSTGTATWPIFARRESTGARTKSSGYSPGRWICWPRSCRCIANWPRADRSS